LAELSNPPNLFRFNSHTAAEPKNARRPRPVFRPFVTPKNEELIAEQRQRVPTIAGHLSSGARELFTRFGTGYRVTNVGRP
jgi:hypothetical protein